MNSRHLFLLIGQSNMVGHGEMDRVLPIENELIQVFRNDRWQKAVEPLHGDRNDQTGVGLGMSYASSILKRDLVDRVGLIPCAVDSTAIADWLPGTPLYQKTLDTLMKTQKTDPENNRLGAILWHQGENDAKDKHMAEQYGDRLVMLVWALRRDLNAPNLPFISGELGDFINAAVGGPYGRQISAVLKELETTLPDYACVSADGLVAKDDGLHFNAHSLREFGKRYALAYKSLISYQTP
ncbi:MAG: sialate O-acetylesterase [Candidatus Marinimicrobia bacterium]|jgi:hypothetical protein|nr:sialate O-acetylesterase [Candidatus Neomarinimicrobiota bacterium]MCK9484034.1 sialate O-acetylesterase [Candidatus Neomarinimicrobiota bacterium]MCK9560089.1 sialate O-acetylesterase [Candidatus Neomarinimicrobiota bacterium]